MKFKHFTIREVTKIIGISRPSVMGRIKKVPHFRRDYMMKKKGLWVINSKGLKRIDYGRHDSRSNSFHVKKGKSRRNKMGLHVPTTKNALIKDLVLATKTNASQQATIYNQQQTIKQLENLTKQVVAKLPKLRQRRAKKVLKKAQDVAQLSLFGPTITKKRK